MKYLHDRRIGLKLMALALVVLVAAGAIALASFNLEQPPHVVRGLVARVLASASALLFAAGYAIVMCVGGRVGHRSPITGLRRLSAGAWLLAALIGSYQLVFINDSVSLALKIALMIGIFGGALAGVLAFLAGVLFRRSTAASTDHGRRPDS